MRLIRTERDYEAALERVDELLAAEPGSEAADECHILAMLIEEYEAAHHPIPPPTPLEAIRLAMEQRGLSRRDLEKLIGPSGRVSEVLSGKRSLTLPMIRRLHRALNVPAEILIREPKKRRSA